MVARRLLLSLLTIIALILVPFALTPQVAQAATVTFLVDRNDDVTSAGTCNDVTINDCSLRDAILRANNPLFANDVKVISFELFTSGQVGGVAPHIFTVSSGGGLLPQITANNVQIDADDAFGVPQVVIDGNGRAAGFQFRGNNGLVRGLSMYGFSNSGIEPFFGSAIYITGSGTRVENSYIGIAPNGTVPTGKANFSGIRIDGAAATGNIIGGSGGSAVANYISGNTQNGVIIREASGNFIQNNIIGLTRSGNTLVPLGNGQYGVQVTSLNGRSANNTIGGTSTSLANIIGANGQAGVLVRGSGTTTTTIQANYIGIDKNTDTDFGNAGDGGVVIEAGASDTSLAGSISAPLVISGNNGYGVLIRAGDGNAPTNNTISGTTFIGTNRAGAVPLANNLGGVSIQGGASTNTISGSNVRIGGNGGPGVLISGAGTSGNSVQGALIGVAPNPNIANATLDIPNAGGILIDRGAQLTLVSGNTVSANDDYGIRLSEALSSTIQTNFVGLNLARTGTSPNGGPGIAVAESRNSLIGGGDTSLGNTIGGNGGPGVVITGTTTLSTTVDGNQIGLRRSAIGGAFNAGAGNGGDGVLVENGPSLTTIGAAVGNTIAGGSTGPGAATHAGVRIAGSATTTVTIGLNQIGWVANGSNPPIELPAGNGITVQGAGTVVITGNSVRFSTGSAVRVTGATNITVAGNTLNESDGDGVLVDGAALNVDVLDNTIRGNAGDAVRVLREARQVAIQNNQMAANGGAIVLENTSIYDGTLPDTNEPGANHDIDPPFGLRVTQSGLIAGFVYTSTVKTEAGLSPVSACITCTIEVFRPDPTLAAPDGQGWERLRVEQGGSTGDRITQFAADGSFVAQLAGPLPKQLLLAATDGFGNTSQFAVFNPSAGITLTPLSPSPAAQNAVPGQTVTYTLELANNGTLDLNNLQFQTGGTLADWVVQRTPAGNPLSLPAGASRTLTVTLTLPTGANPNVQVPKVDTTTITVTSAGLVTETEPLVTTVLARPVLRVSPASGTGRGKPGDSVTYQHRVFNDGNIPVTVRLQSRTVDPADSGRIWTTTLNNSADPILITLQPGLFADVSVNVRVPTTAQVVDSQGNPVSATTFITGTVDAFPAITLPFSDTTRVSLRTAAEMVTNEEQDGAAGGTVTFFHTVTNTSNGIASFRLNVQANFASQVQFSSDDVVISNNIFTLDNVFQPPSRRNTMTLRVTVTVNQRLLPGDTETINIFLTDPLTNESIGGATVTDRINIRTGLRLPRLWLPLIVAN